MSTAETFRSAFEGEVDGSNALSFRNFMDLALYGNGVGYYTGSRAKTGREGDFFTSVSVGGCFGQLLAEWIAGVWKRLGRPEDFQIVEQGGHDGQLARDILKALDHRHPELGPRVRYVICDRGRWPAENEGRVSRVERIFDVVPSPGVYLCNELLDALPVHLVRLKDGDWRELWVSLESDPIELVERDIAADSLLDGVVSERLPTAELPDGYTTEICLELEGWANEAASTIERGAVLVIDYGFFADDYYHSSRTEGTLQAYREHQKVDPLHCPGESDLTAHIDWTAVQTAAAKAGLEHAGFADQGTFLTRLAEPLLREWESSGAAALHDRKWIRQFQTLTHPGMMGRSFGAMAFSKGEIAGELLGFS